MKTTKLEATQGVSNGAKFITFRIPFIDQVDGLTEYAIENGFAQVPGGDRAFYRTVTKPADAKSIAQAMSNILTHKVMSNKLRVNKMKAYILDTKGDQISETLDIDSDDDFKAVETEAEEIDQKCCIKWDRSTDGQTGYWSPSGASLKPYWYGKYKDHWNKGKQHALKPNELKAESFINARCKTSDKAKWVIAARAEGLKLTEWIVKNLNAIAKQD